jgi:hypothetical protein
MKERQATLSRLLFFWKSIHVQRGHFPLKGAGLLAIAVDQASWADVFASKPAPARAGAFPASPLHIAIKRALPVVADVRGAAHRFYPDGPQKLDTAWLSPVTNKRGRE